jgi:hypothetical protein
MSHRLGSRDRSIDGLRAVARHVPDRPVTPAVLVFSVCALFSIALLVSAGGDASRLVDAGRVFTDPTLTPPSLTVDSEFGFDGLFYYRLANAPFSTDKFVEGVRFDLPALRAQRVLYPLLAWGASFGGRPGSVPWALLGVNLVAMAAVGGLGGGLALASGRHVLWGLLIATYPGFAYSLSLDLTEIVATACVLAGLLALRRRHYRAATVALVLAVLSRETTVIVPVGVLLAWGWEWVRAKTASGLRPDARAAATALVALAAFAAWQGWLWHQWGALPLSLSTGENVRFPLQGLIRSLKYFAPTDGRALFRIACLALLATLGILATVHWRRSNAPLHERLAFILALCVVIMQSDFSWPDATSFLRVGTEYWVLGVLTVLGVENMRTLGVLATPAAGLWGVAAASRVA